MAALPVAFKYFVMRLSCAKMEVVAPISAPILVIVAFPVQLMELAPGPKYSKMAFVPPDTVNSPATRKITSFGAVHPFFLPVKRMPM